MFSANIKLENKTNNNHSHERLYYYKDQLGCLEKCFCYRRDLIRNALHCIGSLIITKL